MPTVSNDEGSSPPAPPAQSRVSSTEMDKLAAAEVRARLDFGHRPPVEGHFGATATAAALRTTLAQLCRRCGVPEHPVAQEAVRLICRAAPECAEEAERLAWAIEDADRREFEAWRATPEGRESLVKYAADQNRTADEPLAPGGSVGPSR